jgi:hypothetical protein
VEWTGRARCVLSAGGLSGAVLGPPPQAAVQVRRYHQHTAAPHTFGALPPRSPVQSVRFGFLPPVSVTHTPVPFVHIRGSSPCPVHAKLVPPSPCPHAVRSGVWTAEALLNPS